MTHHGATDTGPVWSPDGSRIALRSDRNGNSDVFVMNADGSNQHRLTASGSALYPAWSPSGDKIAYASDECGDGWLALADGFLIIAQTEKWIYAYRAQEP